MAQTVLKRAFWSKGKDTLTLLQYTREPVCDIDDGQRVFDYIDSLFTFMLSYPFSFKFFIPHISSLYLQIISTQCRILSLKSIRPYNNLIIYLL